MTRKGVPPLAAETDPIVVQAKENVRKAIETRSLTERQNWLGEALR